MSHSDGSQAVGHEAYSGLKSCVVARSFCKSSPHDARLKIETILSVLHDARIQTRWISCNMLLAKKSLSPQQNVLAINGTSRKKNSCCNMSLIYVPTKCPRKMSPNMFQKNKGKPNYKLTIGLELYWRIICLDLGNSFLWSSGAIGQLLDSLEEIQVLTGANNDDVNFLQNFFEHQTLQALLEVRKFSYIFFGSNGSTHEQLYPNSSQIRRIMEAYRRNDFPKHAISPL